MQKKWNIFKYGDWSDEHGMYEQERTHTGVSIEDVESILETSEEPLTAYLVGPLGTSGYINNLKASACIKRERKWSKKYK